MCVKLAKNRDPSSSTKEHPFFSFRSPPQRSSSLLETQTAFKVILILISGVEFAVMLARNVLVAFQYNIHMGCSIEIPQNSHSSQNHRFTNILVSSSVIRPFEHFISFHFIEKINIKYTINGEIGGWRVFLVFCSHSLFDDTFRSTFAESRQKSHS